MDVFTFTTEKPKLSGYYFVIWEHEESPELRYISYSNLDGIETWKWAFHDEDSPKEFPNEIADLNEIKFSQNILEE